MGEGRGGAGGTPWPHIKFLAFIIFLLTGYHSSRLFVVIGCQSDAVLSVWCNVPRDNKRLSGHLVVSNREDEGNKVQEFSLSFFTENENKNPGSLFHLVSRTELELGAQKYLSQCDPHPLRNL